MAAAFDSAAKMASQAESKVDERESGASGHMPVFDAFGELGFRGRDIAALAGVTPPTVSKWKSAKARIPEDKLVFLTLVLAHLTEEAKDMDVDGARAYLAYQNVLNRDLPGTKVRAGARRFRDWWQGGKAGDWTERLRRTGGHLRRGSDVLKALRNKGTTS